MGRIRAFGAPTHTVAVCNIVIVAHEDPDREPTIYVQDFTPDLEKIPLKDLPTGIVTYINTEHCRRFENMRQFTKWLVDYPAVVDNCWVIR